MKNMPRFTHNTESGNLSNYVRMFFHMECSVIYQHLFSEFAQKPLV